MKKLINLLSSSVIALTTISATFPLFSLETQSTQCTFGKNVRIIEVVYPESTPTPCEVRYTKNGESKVLWQAQAETGFCEQKASDFIEKQRSWGWKCESQTSTRKDEKEVDGAELAYAP